MVSRQAAQLGEDDWNELLVRRLIAVLDPFQEGGDFCAGRVWHLRYFFLQNSLRAFSDLTRRGSRLLLRCGQSNSSFPMRLMNSQAGSRLFSRTFARNAGYRGSILIGS